MLKMLLEGETQTSGNFWSQWGLLIILVVLLVGMFAWNYFRQKKYQKQEEQMMQDLKVGSKVKTYSGIYGTIVKMYETTDGKVAVLSLDGKSTMEVDFRAIYGVDAKKEIKDEPVEEKVEESQQEELVEQPVEEKKEEKPKRSSKKSKKAE